MLAFILACLAGLATAGAGSVEARTSGTCTASQLRARVLDSTGAVGTIAVSITLTNAGAACTLHGYAGLQLRDARGALATTVVHGVLGFLIKTPRTVRLAAGGKATLLIAYNHVPSGTKPCPMATKLLIRPPGGSGWVGLSLRLDPCRNGTILEAPILAGLQHA